MTMSTKHDGQWTKGKWNRQAASERYEAEVARRSDFWKRYDKQQRKIAAASLGLGFLYQDQKRRAG